MSGGGYRRHSGDEKDLSLCRKISLRLIIQGERAVNTGVEVVAVHAHSVTIRHKTLDTVDHTLARGRIQTISRIPEVPIK